MRCPALISNSWRLGFVSPVNAGGVLGWPGSPQDETAVLHSRFPVANLDRARLSERDHDQAMTLLRTPGDPYPTNDIDPKNDLAIGRRK